MNLFSLDGSSPTIYPRNLFFTPNLRLRACLAMCLNFPQFEPEVAYKTLAYKKKSVFAMNGWVSFRSRPSLSLVSPGRAINKIFTRIIFVECKHSCRWSIKKQVRIHEISRSPARLCPLKLKRTDIPSYRVVAHD